MFVRFIIGVGGGVLDAHEFLKCAEYTAKHRELTPVLVWFRLLL